MLTHGLAGAWEPLIQYYTTPVTSNRNMWTLKELPENSSKILGSPGIPETPHPSFSQDEKMEWGKAPSLLTPTSMTLPFAFIAGWLWKTGVAMEKQDKSRCQGAMPQDPSSPLQSLLLKVCSNSDS